jgi:succinylglutamate desuccinylase
VVEARRIERKQFIQAEIERLFSIGRFHKEVIQVDEGLIDSALDLHFARIDSWNKNVFTSHEEGKRADRHKVGANTALAIMEHKPLKIVPGCQTNAYESSANGYLAMKLALARVFSENESKLKIFKFPEREILQMLSTLNQAEWTPKTFSLDLYRMEEQYLEKYNEFLLPTGAR